MRVQDGFDDVASTAHQSLALGTCLDQGQGVAAPDYPAAAKWYTLAADAGDVDAANNIRNMYVVGRGRARQIMPLSATSCSTL